MSYATAPSRGAEPLLPRAAVHSFVSYGGGQRTIVSHDAQGDQLVVEGERSTTRWLVNTEAGETVLHSASASGERPSEVHLLALLEAAFTWWPQVAALQLATALPEDAALVQAGAIELRGRARPSVSRDALWQQPSLWLPTKRDPMALRYELTGGYRHPRRAPKLNGELYRRFIPWLNKTLTFRSVDVERDLSLFQRWMNEPTVAYFWQEEGDLEKQRKYLQGVAADPHVAPLFACLDGEPFGYFEAYWAKEDRIAPFYDAQDFDRGYHVLIGEPACRGKDYLTAWMPSMAHYLFLDDCRTQRIVIEPRIDNQKMLKSLARCGFAHIKEFDFPHKRAVLGMLLRERFFADALWVPRASPDSTAPASSLLHSA